MRTSSKILATVTFSAVALTSQAAMAYQAGDFYLRAGIEKADISADELSREENFHLAGGYLFLDKLGVELGVGEDVEHDFALDSGAQGSLDRMPATLLLNYYPLGGIDASRIQPFLGAGVNYTRFSSVSTDGPGSMDVDDDYGIAAQVGMDLVITDNIHATGYARYSEIDAEFEGGGTSDKNRLDPLTAGAGITYRF